ncbi:3-phosphoserine/phosphohydroxythreonine aminotransferase [Lewinellaceae bacterium SD302]|nr:3-phosphoserine/phosphohydroxythreonine aminotransferase [Lewinellaceae bacterium SD302]
MKIHNFSSGPAILPQSVLNEAAEGVKNLNGEGLSVLEISHRSKAFVAILEEAVELVYELLNIPRDTYEVLFLTGGASSQFFMAPMNLLAEDQMAGYLDTGAWSAKAIKEAKAFGETTVVASSKEDNYNHIPTGYDIPAGLRYLHVTSNNTIFGTQMHSWPETDAPLVADMSSDIFSRELPIDKFGLIYAGAQKNMGPAGTTLVIVRKDLLGQTNRHIPTMLDYQTHIAKNSSFNTPPVFPIYVSMLTMRWIKEQGGVKAMEKINAEKAQLLYDEIDNNPRFKGTVKNQESRSLMNVTFVPTMEEDKQKFFAACEAAGISTINGHRSVGGFRASIYNAMPKESVELLVKVMREF